MNFKLLPALFFACLFIVAGPAHAVKMPKVDICHFSIDEGMFKKSGVSGNALQEHLGHGDVIPGVDNEPPLPDLDDDCFAIIVPDPIARAYIDVDQDGAYDGTKDVDIAVLLDSDGTPGLSVGDTLELGHYPKDFDPCPDMTLGSCDLGTFTITTHTVLFINAGGPPVLNVVVNAFNPDPTGFLASFWTFPGQEAIELESYAGNKYLFTDIRADFMRGGTLEVDDDPAWGPLDFTTPQISDAFEPTAVDDPYLNVIIY